MNALLLAVTLVLVSGDRIAVEGEPREDDGVVVFRSGGLLYSVPAEEVAAIEETPAAAQPKPTRRLIVSEEKRRRLIEELERNHSGPPATIPPVPKVPPSEPAHPPEDEPLWRSRARAHEEAILRARENVALLEARAEELQAQIHAFVTLGFKPREFTYQTTQLARTLERIPYAKLEVERAERAWRQFREDARRAGVMPGWLR